MINLSKETCFLVVSHSGNLDVLQGLAYNFNKFSFQISNSFLLLNSNIEVKGFENFEIIISKKNSWNSEMKNALNVLKKLGFKKVLLWLDDFYLTKKPNKTDIEFLINNYNKKYIGLRPQKNKIKISNIKIRRKSIEKISNDFPYISSLKASIWEIDHFMKILELSKNIWDFEKISIPNITHYQSTKNIFHYHHVVEKGLWKYYTPFLFIKEYEISKGSRKLESNIIGKFIVDILRYFKVKFFGY